MDKLNELIFLMPDYELEGFPRSLTEDKAAKVLSGWVALWHPVLVCGAGRIPRWHQASRLPSELASTLFVLPPISQTIIASTAADEISTAGGLLLEPTESWREFQSQLLTHFPQLPHNEVATELAAEFAALGYAFLQVQLMTRQLRYTSNLDVALFEEQVLKATEAVMESDATNARGLIQACFDTLGQERDHYYSNDAHLIDLALLADTTLGKSLHRQLTDSNVTNFIASASLLRKLKEKSPENFDLLVKRQSESSIAIAGGQDIESPWPLASRESIARGLAKAPAAYRELGVQPPTVFARNSHGLTSDAPSLLSRFGFRGAVLMAFTGGSYPSSSQTKISWEAQDGSRIPAIAGEPLDASGASSFLSLGWSLGEALDRQNVPTLVFAHWPGKTGEYFELLRIVTQHTPALGRFTLIDTYFSDTTSPYHHERLDANGFAFNWLAQAEEPGKLIDASKYASILQSQATSIKNLCNLRWQLQNLRNKPEWPKDDKGEPQAPLYSPVPVSEYAADLDQLYDGMDLLVDHPEQYSAETVNQLNDICQRIGKRTVHALAPLLTNKKNTVSEGDSTSASSGKLLINPRSNPVRSMVRTEAAQTLLATESWHFAAGSADNNRLTCVDLPSLGFVVAPLESSSIAKPDKLMLADSSGMLRNEFIEIQVDTQRGHLRTLHIPGKRGNRLSAMIAFRTKSGAKYEHSEMVARNCSVIANSSMLGAIRTEGSLIWQGKSVGDFAIEFEVRRGTRLVSADISLSNLKFTDECNPWLSAFILRLAWPTEAAILRTYPEGRRTNWSGSKVVASELIEIDEADYQTQFLTGGLAFHARQDARILETILAVHGQTSVRHQVAFAVDLPYPLPTAQQFMDQVYQCDLTGSVAAASGWLVTVDCKSVHVDLECPLQDDQGKTVGLRLLVSELHGKSVTANIQFLRDIAEAQRVDYCGGKISRVTANADTLTIALRANEQSLVDLLWKV